MSVSTPSGSRPRTKRAGAAEYIAVEMSRLARMATANDFPLLAYLIDMAVLEAWREASDGSRSKGVRLGQVEEPVSAAIHAGPDDAPPAPPDRAREG
jgi:hypothetical protein